MGMPHEIKGESIYAYVTLKSAGIEEASDDTDHGASRPGCARRSGPSPRRRSSSSPTGLPKTRSGKIMRRVLRKIVEGSNEFGDTSTLADPGVVTDLVEGNKDLVG